MKRYVPTVVTVTGFLLLALAGLLAVTGCATTSALDVLEESRARTQEARQRVEGLAVAIATARSICDALGKNEPAECALLDDVPIEKARVALRDADAAQMIAQDVLRALAPYADAAHAVLAKDTP